MLDITPSIFILFQVKALIKNNLAFQYWKLLFSFFEKKTCPFYQISLLQVEYFRYFHVQSTLLTTFGLYPLILDYLLIYDHFSLYVLISC